MASKLHGVEVEVEVIRRKGDVIELTEAELGPTTNASRRSERGATTTTANKSNRPSTSDQVFEEAQPPPLPLSAVTTTKTGNNSKCDGNSIKSRILLMARFKSPPLLLNCGGRSSISPLIN